VEVKVVIDAVVTVDVIVVGTVVVYTVDVPDANV